MTRGLSSPADALPAGQAGGGRWAELARAERERDAALAACAAARAEAAALEEDVAFLHELVRGATEHAAATLGAAHAELTDLRAECAALLVEITLLDTELAVGGRRGVAGPGADW